MNKSSEQSVNATNTECPLGILDCGSTITRSTSCANYFYCKNVCRAWGLPLFKFRDYWCVGFLIPFNFTPNGYKAYMKKYGWAESIDLPYRRFNNYLDVQWNVLKGGFAQAVPLIDLERFPYTYLYKPEYSKDSNGLWWYGDRRTLKQVLKKGTEAV